MQTPFLLAARVYLEKKKNPTKKLTWKLQTESGPKPSRRAWVGVKHRQFVKHSFTFHLFLY